MKWGTRAGMNVDRAACAWLLCRFADRDTELLFVENTDEVPADPTPFDLRGVELSVTGGLFDRFDGLYEYRRGALLLGREPL